MWSLPWLRGAVDSLADPVPLEEAGLPRKTFPNRDIRNMTGKIEPHESHFLCRSHKSVKILS